MKRIVALVLSLALLCSIPVFASAATESEGSSSQPEIVWYADGSRMEIHTEILDNSASPYSATASYTRSATTTGDYYNVDDVLVFTYTLKASFSYDKVSYSKCTSASDSYSIKKSGWKKVESNVSRSGDTAYADATFSGNGDYAYPSLQLSCDPFGNISD